MENLLTAEEVSRILRIKISTVYDWVYTGVLPSIRAKKGRRRSVVRFRQADIEEFIKLNFIPARTTSPVGRVDRSTSK